MFSERNKFQYRNNIRDRGCGGGQWCYIKNEIHLIVRSEDGGGTAEAVAEEQEVVDLVVLGDAGRVQY